MKKIIKQVSMLLLFAALTLSATPLLAQGPPPPPPSGHGATGNQPPTGGNAPIGSGMVILLAMGAAYAGKKVYDARAED
jgi:hypothetical protein